MSRAGKKARRKTISSEFFTTIAVVLIFGLAMMCGSVSRPSLRCWTAPRR